MAVGVPLARALRFPCGALLTTFVDRSEGLRRNQLLYFKIQYYTVFLINRTALGGLLFQAPFDATLLDAAFEP